MKYIILKKENQDFFNFLRQPILILHNYRSSTSIFHGFLELKFLFFLI
jgi:hypothetical protein